MLGFLINASDTAHQQPGLHKDQILHHQIFLYEDMYTNLHTENVIYIAWKRKFTVPKQQSLQTCFVVSGKESDTNYMSAGLHTVLMSTLIMGVGKQ
jgi:hypothetical protein